MTPYEARHLHQTEEWARGRLKHNHIDGECCPDFSCCHPDLFEMDIDKRIERLNEVRERHGLNKHFDA